ncbi:MAG: helix-turn-helix domain-containing protein, partial [Firmicutes bacterium]|nr:helix-turn-helix domain-containing protein [Bacillota bacterium]
MRLGQYQVLGLGIILVSLQVGTTRETVSRVLGDLRRHGAIALEREGILIQDQEAL